MKPNAIKVTVSVTDATGRDETVMELSHDFSDGKTAMYLHTFGHDPKGAQALKVAENALGSALADVQRAMTEAPGVQRFDPIPKREWNGKFDA